MALPPYSSSFSSFSPLPPPPPPESPQPPAQLPPPPPPQPESKKEPPRETPKAQPPKPAPAKAPLPAPLTGKIPRLQPEALRMDAAKPPPKVMVPPEQTPPVWAASSAPVVLLPPAAAPAPVRAEPVKATEPVFEPPEEVAGSPNLLLAVLRRWPWMVIGLAVGLVGGFLFHMQRPPVYQSTAQLLVIKNRVEMSTSAGAGGAGDARVAYVEDYVATQVTLLRSQKILEQAAKKLDAQKLDSPPPAGDAERVAFLTSRFAVAREKEPGTNAASNVLALTFRSPNPADAPKYLRAIIDAYQDELASLYDAASDTTLKRLDAEIKALNNDLSKINANQGQLTRKLLDISGEELAGVRARLTANRTRLGELRLRKREVQRDLELIAKTGKARPDRLATMDALGVKPDQPVTGTTQTAEEVLIGLELRRKDLAQRLGPDHPDMLALDSQIKLVKEKIVQRDAAGWMNDELAKHQRRLETDSDTMADQLVQLENTIKADEVTVGKMGPVQEELDRGAADRRDRATRLQNLLTEQTQVLNTRSTGGYKVERITPPTDAGQVAPVLFQSLLLGAALGLLLGGGLALTAELSDRGFRTPTEIRRRLGVPVLGHIPQLRIIGNVEKQSAGGLDRLLTCFYRPSSREAEAYRGVRTQLYFSTQGRGHQVIQITSPGPGDGKSTLAANLAISIAQSGKRVVLLDCDFRKPRVHKLFNLSNPDVGLASVMGGDARLEAAIRTCEIENLYLMPCGERPANPAELLTRPKFQELLAELRERYDFVVIDSPPVLAVSDPSAVAPRVDGVLVVLRMSKNTRPAAERTREQLAGVGARILGVVVNASNDRAAGYGGYGYTYQYQAYHEDYVTVEEPVAVPRKG